MSRTREEAKKLFDSLMTGEMINKAGSYINNTLDTYQKYSTVLADAYSNNEKKYNPDEYDAQMLNLLGTVNKNSASKLNNYLDKFGHLFGSEEVSKIKNYLKETEYLNSSDAFYTRVYQNTPQLDAYDRYLNLSGKNSLDTYYQDELNFLKKYNPSFSLSSNELLDESKNNYNNARNYGNNSMDIIGSGLKDVLSGKIFSSDYDVENIRSAFSNNNSQVIEAINNMSFNQQMYAHSLSDDELNQMATKYNDTSLFNISTDDGLIDGVLDYVVYDKSMRDVLNNEVTRRNDNKNFEIINNNKELEDDLKLYYTAKARLDDIENSNAVGMFTGQQNSTTYSDVSKENQEILASIENKYKNSDVDFLATFASYSRRKNAEDSERFMTDISAYAVEHPVLSSALSISTGLLGGIAALPSTIGTGIKDAISNKPVPIDTNTADWFLKNTTDTIRSTVSESLLKEDYGELKSLLYSTGMSMADFLAVSAVTGFQMPAVTQFVLGTNAGIDTVKSVTEKGGTTSQALWSGIFAGTFEALFENISIGHLSEIASSKDGVNLVYNILKSSFEEGSEEFLTDAANMVVDVLINGNNSDLNRSITSYMAAGKSAAEAKSLTLVDQLKNMGASFLGGAISGGLIQSVGGSVNLKQINNKYSEIGYEIDSAGDTQNLINIAKKYAKNDSEINEIVSKLEKAEQKQVSNSQKELINSNLQGEVESRLVELGVDSETATADAQLIIESYNKKKTTVDGKSKFANRVLSELIHAQKSDYGTNQWANTAIAAIQEEAKATPIQYRNRDIGKLYSVASNNSAVQADSRFGKLLTPKEDTSVKAVDDKGNEKGIKKVVGITPGEGITVELTDGTEFFYDTRKENTELKVLDREQEMLLMQAATLNSPENANAFIKGYRQGQDIDAYTKEWKTVQQSKTSGEEISVSAFDTLSPAQVQLASSSVKSARTYLTGGVSFDTHVDINKQQRQYLHILHSYGKKHGIRYNIDDSLTSPSGRKANAQFKGNSNVISIALDSDQPMLVVAGHETFHYLRDAAPESAKVLQDFVIERLKTSKDFDYEKRFNELSELYNTADEDVINEEIAANAMFDVLTNEKAVRELAKSDKKLFDKIKDIIEKIITDLKGELNRYFADKAEARALKDDIEALEQIRTLFDTVLWEIEQKGAKESNNESANKNQYSFVAYSEKQKDNWKNSKRIVLYQSESQYADFIDIALKDKSFHKKIYFGAISTELAEKIKKNTGIDVAGYNCSISADSIRKILLNSHGDNNTEKLRGQRAVTKNDILSISNVILDAKSIEKSKILYDGKPAICFSKTIKNEKTNVIAVVSDKHLDLYIQTAYINTKRSLATPIDEKIPYQTSNTPRGTASNKTIPQKAQSVNNSISENADNDTIKFSLQENYDEYEKPITREDIETVQKIPKKSINDFASNEIISTQKWAHKFYKQLGAKSPFFRAWFGDWREFDTTPIKVARIANANNQRPYQVKNDDTGWDIQVSGKINDETTVHQSKASKYAVSYLSYLDDIIKNAVLLETETLKNKKSYNSLLMHSLYSVADIGNGAEVLKLNVEEIYNPNSSNTIKRAYKLINIEKQQSGVTGSGVTPSLSTQTVDVKTIADLYSYVKSKDAKFNHKSANSILLNDDGTPKKFYHGTSDSFYEFNTDEISYREGSFFFAENIEDAESYGNRIISAYLSAENLADYNNQPSEFYRLENKKAQVAWLKQKGYDGWYADFDSDGWGEVSVFHPNQIKSADENIGTFDSKSDDIRYSLQENEETTLAHEELLKKNKDLHEAYSLLREGIRFPKTTNSLVAQELLYNAARRTVKKWGIHKSNPDYINTVNRITDIFKYLCSPQAEINSAINSVAAIAKDVIPSSSDVTQIAVDSELQFMFDSIKQDLKGTYIYLNNKQVNQIFKDHKSLRNYTQNNTLGKLIITTDPSGAVPIDDVWDNLTDNYPELFDEADKNTDSNQIIYKLVDFLNAGVPMYQSAAEMTTADIDTIAVNFAYDAMIDYARNVLPKTVTKQNIGKLQETVKRYEAKIKIAKRTQKNIITRKNAQIEKTKKHYQNRIKENKRKRETTKKKAQLRSNTIKSVNKLNTMLNNPTDKKHIHDGLEKIAEEFTKLFHGNSIFLDELQINRVIDEYRKLENADDILSRHFDEDIIEELNILKEFITDIDDSTALAKMSLEATQAVENVTEHIYNMIINADTLFRDGKKESFFEFGQSSMSDMEKKKTRIRSKHVGRNMTPYYYFKTLGDVMTGLWDDMRTGMSEYGKKIYKAKKDFWSIINKYHAENWVNDKERRFKFKTASGVELNLTVGELMSIYATSKRESTSGKESQHLTLGGIVLQEKAYKHIPEFIKKKLKKANVPTIPTQLSLEDQIKLNNMLSQQQREFVDAMVGYMSTTLSDMGNETSLKLHGYKKFLEKYYFPYSVSKNHIKKDLNKPEVTNALISNKGMTRATQKKAGTPVYINDFTDVVAKHINDMVEYNTMAIPQKNLVDIINFIDKTSASGSIRQTIEHKFGKWAVEYYETLIRDISAGVQGDVNEEVLNKFLSKFKKTAVAANLRVVIQQPSAFARAMMMIDPKYFATNPFKGSYDVVKKYSGVAIIKEIGGFDMSSGVGITDWLLQGEVKGIKNKAKSFLSVTDSTYRDEVLSSAASKADEMTWNYLFNVCLKETKDKTHLNGDALFEAAGKRFNEVIEATQVYDSVLARSQYMRGKGTLTKIVTSFMAEPTKTINMLDFAFEDFKNNKSKDSGKVLMRTIGGVVASSAFNILLKSIIDMGRDDDEYQSLVDKYAEAVTNNAWGEFDPLQKLPFIKDIVSRIQGYDIQRSDMNIIAEVVDNVSALFTLFDDSFNAKTPKQQKEQIEKTISNMIGSLGNFAGLPVSNIMRDFNAIVNFGKGITDNKTSTQESIKFNALDGFIKSFDNKLFNPFEALRTDINDLYNEMQDGTLEDYNATWDSALAELIYSGKTEEQAAKKLKADLKTKIKGQLYRGEITDETAKEYLMQYLGDENAYWTVKEWQFRFDENNDGESFSKYMYLEKAVLAGEDITDEVSELTANNTKESSVRKEVTSIIEDAFNEGVISEDRMIELLGTYKGFAEKGNFITTPIESDADVLQQADVWAGKALSADGQYSSYDAFDEAVIAGMDTTSAVERLHEIMYTDKQITSHARETIQDAYLSGELTDNEAIDRLQKYGGFDAEDSTNKIKYWDFKEEYPDSELDDDVVIKYLNEIKSTGISVEDYENYYELKKDAKGVKDENGNTVTGSKKKEIIEVIDGMPFTTKQKDALYLAEGYARSKIYEAPWH